MAANLATVSAVQFHNAATNHKPATKYNESNRSAVTPGHRVCQSRLNGMPTFESHHNFRVSIQIRRGVPATTGSAVLTKSFSDQTDLAHPILDHPNFSTVLRKLHFVHKGTYQDESTTNTLSK